MNLQHLGLWILVLGLAGAESLALRASNSIHQCSTGPSNWCESISNAKQCNAVRHCIQTVWEKQDVPEDNDSICKICLDMVDQAREQLESNETQYDLKAVFDGSCRLIVLKPIVRECMKLADDFIPELVEALSSQMNPQVVCSTAGLCNNAKIDKMLVEYNSFSTQSSILNTLLRSEQYKQRLLSCDECGYVTSIISTKFNITSRDELLESILNLCGHTSSFSNACANIALTYFDVLYTFITKNINSERICNLSGTCTTQYHKHSNSIELRTRSDIGVINKQDIPCELCQQLVHHLQEVLTANTTEVEFKMVLEGLCKQTNGFKTECLSIVDQYYQQIYDMIVRNLDANGACFLIGICPKGRSGSFLGQNDIFPLIPYIKPAVAEVKLTQLKLDHTKGEMNSEQLPIYRSIIPDVMISDGHLCTLCEYFMHFLQETLASPPTEDKIKVAVSHVCDKFTTALRGNCHNFVEMYGDAVIALMIQGFDPRAVCPEINMCPKDENEYLSSKNAKEILSEKPTCPMCLFAVQQAQELIKGNKSKNNIKNVLDILCSHLPIKLHTECVDFVETYSNELIDMLMTDFSPQQICVYINLCTSNSSDDFVDMENEEKLYDETHKETASDLTRNYSKSVVLPECLICERLISEAEKKMGKVKTKADIEKALYKACDKLRKLEDRCHKYVDEFGDKVAALILQEMKPKQICKEIGYCSWIVSSDELNVQTNIEMESVAPSPCILCEFIMVKLENELRSNKTKEEIKREVQSICKKMPDTIEKSCDDLIDKYGNVIISLIEAVPPKTICQHLELCVAFESPINDQVIECGVCYGVASALVPYINENLNGFDSKTLLEVACETLPAKYYKKCSELLQYYSNSIINMIRSKAQPSELCSKIGKCFEEESSSLEFINIKDDSNRVNRKRRELVVDKCTFGQGNWCSN